MGHMVEVRERLKKELGDKYAEPVPPARDGQLTLGKRVYEKNCVVCHGTGGKGDGPGAAGLLVKPADFTDPGHSSYYSDQGRLHVIRKGIEGSQMVGWEQLLGPDEIEATFQYVRSFRTTSAGGSGEHEGHDH